MAQETTSLLSDMTPKANDFLENINIDANRNIHADFDITGEKHKLLLNYKFKTKAVFSVLLLFMTLLSGTLERTT